MSPRSLLEWTQYVSTLAGPSLRSKAIAVNTQKFMDLMRAQEGLTTGQVRQIILLFVRQLVATGQKLSEGGAYDMTQMARLDEMTQSIRVMSEVEVQELASRQTPEQALDDLDSLADL